MGVEGWGLRFGVGGLFSDRVWSSCHLIAFFDHAVNI
jgi:hypothetical protein